jgi:hypothetical protein
MGPGLWDWDGTGPGPERWATGIEYWVNSWNLTLLTKEDWSLTTEGDMENKNIRCMMK